MEATLFCEIFVKVSHVKFSACVQTATEICNGGPHAIYWEMMVTNGRPVEYLLSIYSSSICKAKI